MKQKNDQPGQGLVIFAKSKKRVSAFYRAVLDLTAKEEETSHDVLCGHGIEIVVHAIPKKVAAQIVITKPPQIREETPLKPVFFVKDLASARTSAKANGGFLNPDEMAWQIRGATVLDGWDPEGNVIQLKQRT